MALVKTREELSFIRKACKVTDEIFSNIIRDFYFQTERELYVYIKKEIRRRGLREAFPPIVTSGKRAGNDIHPKPTKELLEGFVIIDFGVRVKGYCSDMTRTIFIGKPTKSDKDFYAKILKAKKLAEKKTKDGVLCAEVDKVARESLGAHKKYFIHTLGHGVGRRIHELPRMYFKRTKDIFKKGMAVTIEPGIYIPDTLGIRIEDTYMVGEKNSEALTKSPQKLLVFPKREC